MQHNNMRSVSFASGVVRAAFIAMWVSLLCSGYVPAAFAADEQVGESPAATLEEDNQRNNYLIGPGDVIQVFVWRNSDLSLSVPVRPDGKVSTPLVEDMVAVGKTPTQLARDIEKRLAEYIRTPQVSVIVSTALGTFGHIKVIGQVKMPQLVSFREGITLLDVALKVGGLTEFAAGNRAKIVRQDEHGKQTVIKVRLADLMQKGKLEENEVLMPGDVIIVPESFF